MFPLEKHNKADMNKLVYYYTEVHAMVKYGFKLNTRFFAYDQDRFKYVWLNNKKIENGAIVIINNENILKECFEKSHQQLLVFDPKYFHIEHKCFNGGELNLHIEEFSWSNGPYPLGPLESREIPSILLNKQKISADMKNRLEYWYKNKN